MNGDLLALSADALVVIGLLGATLGVCGLYRMPDLYTRLHSASKAGYLGLVVLLVALVTTKDGEIIAKSALIAAFLVLTAPVGSHALARAAYRRGESPRDRERGSDGGPEEAEGAAEAGRR